MTLLPQQEEKRPEHLGPHLPGLFPRPHGGATAPPAAPPPPLPCRAPRPPPPAARGSKGGWPAAAIRHWASHLLREGLEVGLGTTEVF